MKKKLLRKPNRAIKWGLILGIALIFGLIGEISASAPFEDNFESYGIGSLADQGGWVKYTGNHWQVNSDYAKTGFKSIKCVGASSCGVHRTGDLISAGTWQFSQRLANLENPCSGNTDYWFNQSLGVRQVGYILIYKPGAVCEAKYQVGAAKFVSLGEVGPDWHTFQIEWDSLTQKVRYKMDSNAWTDWVEPAYNRAVYGDFTGVSFFTLRSAAAQKDYFDDILFGEPPKIRVWGISPESGSTATSTEQTFTIGWEGWDLDWTDSEFIFSFYQEGTGIWVESQSYTPTTESGSKNYTFSDFGFEKNGTYRFHAIAREYPFLIPYGDIVSPLYKINIAVEGWEWLFEMPDYEGWYSEHSKFASSTAIFSGVSGLLSPIYNKVGEFGEKVVDFLNLDEAYERGYSLGKIIPTFRHYVSQIEVFFGGFPIVQIFLAFLVILLGIFIVRLILKFIPGLG